MSEVAVACVDMPAESSSIAAAGCTSDETHFPRSDIERPFFCNAFDWFDDSLASDLPPGVAPIFLDS